MAHELRIGVTGHAQLDADVRRRLGAAVRSLVDEHVLRVLGGAEAVSLTVVTSLAPGSDQVAARALCTSARRRLDAVLPMPVERYETYFDEQQDRAELRALLGEPYTNAVVVRPSFDVDRDPDDPSRPMPAWRAFREAGRRVVDASEIVIAVWDPARAARRGGTEETLRHAVDARRVVLWLDPNDLEHEPRRLCAPRDDGEAIAPGLVAVPAPARAEELRPGFRLG